MMAGNFNRIQTMKTPTLLYTNSTTKTDFRNLASFAVLLMLWSGTSSLQAQTTAFTYQGLFQDSGVPANGTYDLRFTIFDSLSGTNQVGGALTNAATVVSNGLFTVTLD